MKILMGLQDESLARMSTLFLGKHQVKVVDNLDAMLSEVGNHDLYVMSVNLGKVSEDTCEPARQVYEKLDNGAQFIAVSGYINPIYKANEEGIPAMMVNQDYHDFLRKLG